MTEVIATIGYHPSRPERLALLHPDGSVSNYFGQDETREQIACILAAHRMILRDDDTVVMA
jgi:hypothetical protein